MKNYLKKFGILILILLAFAVGVIIRGPSKTYQLTVEDPHGYLIEELEDHYEAGEKVTVKTGIWYDADLIIYLDGNALARANAVEANGEYAHWEYYFEMPNHDAVLTFQVVDGFLG